MLPSSDHTTKHRDWTVY